MDGATVGVGPVSRARTLGMGPRLMLTRLGRDIDAAELLSIGFGLWEDSSSTGWSDWTNREIGVNHSLSNSWLGAARPLWISGTTNDSLWILTVQYALDALLKS